MYNTPRARHIGIAGVVALLLRLRPLAHKSTAAVVLLSVIIIIIILLGDPFGGGAARPPNEPFGKKNK